jgi:hypothetical protein
LREVTWKGRRGAIIGKAVDEADRWWERWCQGAVPRVSWSHRLGRKRKEIKKSLEHATRTTKCDKFSLRVCSFSFMWSIRGWIPTIGIRAKVWGFTVKLHHGGGRGSFVAVKLCHGRRKIEEKGLQIWHIESSLLQLSRVGALLSGLFKSAAWTNEGAQQSSSSYVWQWWRPEVVLKMKLWLKKVELSLYFSSVRVVCGSRWEDEDQHEDWCAPVKMSYLHEAMRLVSMWHTKMWQHGLVIRMICWLQSPN